MIRDCLHKLLGTRLLHPCPLRACHPYRCLREGKMAVLIQQATGVIAMRMCDQDVGHRLRRYFRLAEAAHQGSMGFGADSGIDQNHTPADMHEKHIHAHGDAVRGGAGSAQHIAHGRRGCVHAEGLGVVGNYELGVMQHREFQLANLKGLRLREDRGRTEGVRGANADGQSEAEESCQPKLRTHHSLQNQKGAHCTRWWSDFILRFGEIAQSQFLGRFRTEIFLPDRHCVDVFDRKVWAVAASQSGKTPGLFWPSPSGPAPGVRRHCGEHKRLRGDLPVKRLNAAALLSGFALTLSLGGIARADDSTAPQLQEIQVTATAMPGTKIDIDKIPGNVQILSAADLIREGSASLTTALNSNLSSVSINDDLDDPFQPDILYRGFEASPALGTPQGLAVYQNGVRINEAFGDTVNWDLFPDIAINQVELVSSSPVYGLNALGGAISVTMKNGFTYQGTDVELSGGSYQQRAVAAQYGVNSGAFGFYMAGRALDWDGWRQFSEDRMRDLYAVASYHTDTATLDLSFTRADNAMNGQGPAPVQELAVNRSLVFTGPQTNINTLNFFTLNGNLKITDGWSAQGVLYYRDYAQTVSNGNTTDYEACTNVAGILCQPDGVTPLTNAQEQTLPAISNGGANIIGENDYELIHAWGRGGSLQLSNNQAIAGHDNQFSAGVAVDYASTNFYTGAQIGLINSQLL